MEMKEAFELVHDGWAADRQVSVMLSGSKRTISTRATEVDVTLHMQHENIRKLGGSQMLGMRGERGVLGSG